MKAIIQLLAVAILIGVSCEVFAQGEPDFCIQCVCKADGLCSDEDGDCPVPPNQDCASVTFTADCSGNHVLIADLDCTDEDYCDDCRACVSLYKTGAGLVGSCTSGCTPGWCDVACPAIPLDFGISYTLFVCLINCNDSECGQCAEKCVARGWVLKTNFGTDCNPMPPCNP